MLVSTADLGEPQILPILLQALKDPHIKVRLAAIIFATEQQYYGHDIMHCILSSLKDRDQQVRLKGLGYLSQVMNYNQADNNFIQPYVLKMLKFLAKYGTQKYPSVAFGTGALCYEYHNNAASIP